MMQQRWEALMATVGIDIQDWMKQANHLTKSLDQIESSWQGAMSMSQGSVQALEESLESLDQQIQLTSTEATKMNRAFAEMSKVNAALDADIADQIRAQKALAAQVIAAEDETTANRQRAAEAQEQADAQRHAGYEQWWKDALKTKEAEEDLAEARTRRAKELDRLQDQYLDGLRRASEHERQLEAIRSRNAEAERYRQHLILGELRLHDEEVEELGFEYNQLGAQAQAAWSRAWKGAEAAGNATRQVGQATKNNTMLYFEFGRAIEDASIGYSLNGIRGMAMGVSNNLARMAEMAGQFSSKMAAWAPHIAIVTSLGFALYQLWANAEAGAQGAKKALDEYLEALERNMELSGQNRRRWFDIEGLETSEQAAGMGRGVNATVSEMDAQLEYLRAARQETERLNILHSDDDRLRAIYSERLIATDERINQLMYEREQLNDHAWAIKNRQLELIAQETEEMRNQLTLGRLRFELEQEMAREAAVGEITAILDPNASAIARLRDERATREEAIVNDRSINTDQVNELLAQNNDAFRQQMEDLFDYERIAEVSDALAHMALEGELTADQHAQAQSALVSLQEQFDAGTITVEMFTDAVDDVEARMRELEQAAEEAAEAERRAALLRGDWEGAGLSMEEALMQRLEQQRMGEWNQLVDDAFRQLYGPSQQEMQQWQREMERMERAAASAADVFHEFQGNPQEATNRLWDFINSIDGQIANTQNSILAMEQTLRVFGDDMDVLRKQELLTAIDDLTSVLNDLYEQQRDRQFLTGEVSGPAWFEDPGLQSPDDSRSTTSRGRSGGVVLTFPNVERITNAAIGEVADGLMEETRRRGVRI